MSDIPPGWREATLGSLGRYLNGRGFKKSEWRNSGLPIIRIQNLTGSNDAYNYYQGEPEDRYTARPGDLLVSWAATLGAYIWTGPKAVVNQHIFKVESNIDTKFHKYLLDFKLQELTRQAHGSGMVHVTRGVFESLSVIIPDRLTEQRAIVDILDDHFSRIDAATATLEGSLRRARAWRHKLVDSLIWDTGAPNQPAGSLLREPMRNGHSARAVRDGEAGIRTLTLTAVTRNVFNDEFTKMATADPQRVAGLWLKSGDLLVQRSNTPQLVGSSALYDGPNDWAIFPDLLIRLRANPDLISSRFMAAALGSERAHRYLRSKAKGLAGSMPKIDQSAIASTLIPVPPKREQAAILAQLAESDELIQRLSLAITEALHRSIVLKRSLLSAAFKGRLGGKDRNTDKIEVVNV